MRNPFFAEFGVKGAQSLSFLIGERSSIRAYSEIDERVDLLRLAVDQKFAERGRPILNRLPQWLEHLRVGILRCKLQQLRESIDRGEGVAADEMQFAPQ